MKRSIYRRRSGPLVGVVLVVLAMVGTGCVTVQSSEGGFLMGGRINVDEGEVANDDIFMMGGRVQIDGEARRDVVVLGGQLIVNGEARDVVSIGGSLRLGPDARIRGDVVNVGGSLNRSPGAEIDGEVVNVGIMGFDQIGLPGFDSAYGWNLWGLSPVRMMWRTTQLVYWLLLGLLVVALTGDRVSSAAHAIAREPLRLGFIGLLGFFALLLLSLLFLLLSFLLIGIPFFLALCLLWVAAYIFGMVAVFQVIGQGLLRAFGKRDASQLALVLAGALVLCVIRYFPFFGGLLWWIAGFLALGAVFATRFGTNRPWFGGRQPTTPPPAPPPAYDAG